MTSEKIRFGELDLLRALAVILMIAYHLLYDLKMYYGIGINPFSAPMFALERFVANLFLLLVGVSFAISFGRMKEQNSSMYAILKRYWLRGLLIIACGMFVTVATYLADPTTYVRFGVLHLIGTSLLVLPFLMPLKEWNALLAIFILALNYFVGGHDVSTSFLLPFHLLPASFTSVDYFPLLPWLAPILIGAAIGNSLYVRRILQRHIFLGRRLSFLSIPSRYALAIYLVHQPILLGILLLLLGKPS